MVIPSLCRENVCTQQSAPVAPSLRRSQSFTAASAPPVTTRKSSSADQSTVCRSSLCASNTACAGLAPALVSQNISALSHATEHSSRPLDPGWNATSSTVSVCPLNLCRGSSVGAPVGCAPPSARDFLVSDAVPLVSDLHTAPPSWSSTFQSNTCASFPPDATSKASRRTASANSAFSSWPTSARSGVEGALSRSASESAADAPVFLCGCVSVSQTKSSGASVCVTSKLGRASNSRILFTSPGWMIFFQLLTNGERLSSSNARCSAAATRRLTTSTFVTTSVFGYCALPSVCSERYNRCLCLNSLRSRTAPHRQDSEGHTRRWCANQSYRKGTSVFHRT